MFCKRFSKRLNPLVNSNFGIRLQTFRYKSMTKNKYILKVQITFELSMALNLVTTAYVTLVTNVSEMKGERLLFLKHMHLKRIYKN